MQHGGMCNHVGLRKGLAVGQKDFWCGMKCRISGPGGDVELKDLALQCITLRS